MIGTTSVEESSETILYPSITACSRRRSDIIRGDISVDNMDLFQRSFNMSEVILDVRFYQRNSTGHSNKNVIRPMESNQENRDKIVISFSTMMFTELPKIGLYVVARNLFLLLLTCSARPCLCPA